MSLSADLEIHVEIESRWLMEIIPQHSVMISQVNFLQQHSTALTVVLAAG